ncbi:MAG TPA: cytochrome b N-terminal domain-containing protein [Opitutus sp.]|nr:cytochrome b N-terminal domain-containing protein [Opitutus sp.]
MSDGSAEILPPVEPTESASHLSTDADPRENRTRLTAPLARVDRALAWCDSLLARWLPAEHNPLAQAGTAANLALAIAVVSGVALLIWYSPSLQFAYPSIADIHGRTLGGWVRAMHRYSADLAMFFIVVHALRVFFARKFAGARWLPWISGLGLIGLVWFIGWTGYWLVWDQPAQQVAVSSMRLLDGLPIFGEPMARLYVADRLVPSLLFFVVFFLHMLLPLAIAVGLAVHLVRVSRARLFPRWPLMLALGVGLALASVLVPAPLDEPAQMAVKAPAFTVDAWYLAPLALALRLQHAGLWLALLGTGLFAVTIPWWLGRRRVAARQQAFVTESRCHACTQCVQDCPFDAITMEPRTDGKPFPSRALVDPAKCVGCGVCAGSCDSEAMSMTWFDTRREEARMEREILETVAAGGPAWVAFVGADIDGGLGLFLSARWRERLPDYQVQAIPTASWLRPKFVEQLFRRGVRGVLVVRDARAEAAARDGNRWVLARLAGERHPVFRSARAGGNENWLVLDADLSDWRAVAKAAAEFQKGRAQTNARPARWRIAVAGVALAIGVSAAVVAPSHLVANNPAPAEPEFVFSFRALGEKVAAVAADPAAEAAKPVHMRGVSAQKVHRSAVTVRVTIDGEKVERVFRPKGISGDGPAIDEWRFALPAGGHRVAVELLPGPTAPALRWDGVIEGRDRRITVLTYEPGAGFRLE